MRPGDVTKFDCPFCGREAQAGCFDVDGFPDGVVGVVHARPTCARFDSLDPDDFIAEVNDATLPPDLLSELRKQRREEDAQ